MNNALEKEHWAKKEIPIYRLTTIALFTLVLSILSIFLCSTRLGITGLTTTTDKGYINVTVMFHTEISLGLNSTVFKAANPGQTRNSYNSSEMENCYADNHCGLNVTNDGNVFINITILETENLFDSGTYNASQHFTYNVTMQDLDYVNGYGGKGDCSTGYSNGLPGPDSNGRTGQWRAVPRDSEEVAICYLNSTSTPEDDNRPDIARVELNITVPTDESTGLKSGTLTFTASSA